MSSKPGNELYNNILLSNHKFTVDLYKVLASENENTFFSPLSIYMALVLVHVGAKGDTANELAKHLHLPEKKEDLLSGVQLLFDELRNPKLQTATEMFLEQTYKVKSSYKENAKKYLNSQTQPVDFINTAAQATEVINKWVSTHTNYKINNLIPPGTLDEYTRLVLVNAIYFKDNWLKTFKIQDTYKELFFTSKDSSVEVDMMHQTDHFCYIEKESFKVLQLPYEDIGFSMVILLPNEIGGLPALENSLRDINLFNLLDEMNIVKINVTLPKFKLEKFIDLNNALQKLGIKTMFSSGADFTDIHEASEQGLVVSKVLHKAFVEVNEEGAEAAAATACVIRKKRCLMVDADMTYDFVADRPFIYLILLKHVIVFSGRVFSI